MTKRNKKDKFTLQTYSVGIDVCQEWVNDAWQTRHRVHLAHSSDDFNGGTDTITCLPANLHALMKQMQDDLNYAAENKSNDLAY